MLDRVTITGADDSISPHDLTGLSRRFPFVEWGILVSQSNTGSPRYPTAEWLLALQRLQLERGASLKLSLHLCGRFVRALLLGDIAFPSSLLEGFQRVQLNFHAERADCSVPHFCKALSVLGERQFIFQIDGATGNEHFSGALAAGYGLDLVPLFDVSGGAGVLPASWPRPMYGRSIGMLYHGYAGGLGPQNLVEQIPRIGMACGFRHWIDMETHVRSDYDRRFDLGKVEQALNICAGFMSPPDLREKRA